MPEGNAAIPPIYEWKLVNRRSKVERTFSQSELSVEGEARLLRLVNDTAQKLNADGFPWDALGPLFEPDVPVDWMLAAQLLGIVGERLPEVFAELATILLSVYPDNEDKTPNPEYETDLRFLRSALSFRLVVDMVKVFVAQNDYQRLADPIGAIIGQAARTGMAKTNTSDTLPAGVTSDGS